MCLRHLCSPAFLTNPRVQTKVSPAEAPCPSQGRNSSFGRKDRRRAVSLVDVGAYHPHPHGLRHDGSAEEDQPVFPAAPAPDEGAPREGGGELLLVAASVSATQDGTAVLLLAARVTGQSAAEKEFGRVFPEVRGQEEAEEVSRGIRGRGPRSSGLTTHSCPC